jgi:uncharacterized membrane protein YkvA (DUF1232 family)
MSRERFHEFVREAVLSMPQALKVLLRLAEDPDIPDALRMVAAGACMHFLSASNTIPGVRGILGHVDDVLVFRLVLERMIKEEPDIMARYRADSPELFDGLEEQLGVIRDYLGAGIQVLDKAVGALDKSKFKGQTAQRCVQEEEAGNWLYDEVQAAMIELDLEEDEVARGLKGLDDVLEGLKRRVK